MKKSVLNLSVFIFLILLFSCSNGIKNIEGNYMDEGDSSLSKIEKHNDELYLITYLTKKSYEAIQERLNVTLTFNEVKNIPVVIYRLSGIGDKFKVVSYSPTRQTLETLQQKVETREQEKEQEENDNNYFINKSLIYMILLEEGLKIEDFQGKQISELKVIRNTDGIIEGLENIVKGKTVILKRK